MRLRKWGLLLLVLFIAIQFVPTDRSNPPTQADRTLSALAAVPERVDSVLRRSCFDCHSYETRWPWYSAVAPVAWIVADDVSRARGALNFSDWAQYDAAKRSLQFGEICEVLTEGEMPLGGYLLLHSEARLSEAEVTEICDWTRASVSSHGATQ